jgi:predicted nucleic acid-binding protein
VIVLDASTVVDMLLRTPAGARAEARFAREDACAPHLMDVEVVQALRRLAAAGRMEEPRCQEALHDLFAMPLERYPHDWLLDRMWELKGNMTAYDAAYVALAEAFGIPLLTRDRRLAAAPGHRARIELV